MGRSSPKIGTRDEGLSVACRCRFCTPPFREKFLQLQDSFCLVVAQDFRFACSIPQLSHALPTYSARQDNRAIQLDRENFSDDALPVCYHAGNGIPFCTHAKRAGSINADADIDAALFRKKSGSDRTRLDQGRKAPLLLHSSCGKIQLVPCAIEESKCTLFHLADKRILPVQISFNVPGKP